MNFRMTAAVLALSISFSATAQELSEDISAETVIATVNGTEITAGHIIHLRSSLPAQYQTLPDDMLFQGIVDQLIDQTLLGELTLATVGESLAVRMAIENERRALLAANAIDSIFADGITQERIEAIYNDEILNAEPQQEYNASHILVATLEEAQAIKTELDEGADFAETAMAKSTGPSGPNGGQLGWFTSGMMVPEFENAVVALETDQISEPVQTQFGWHVIILNETRDLAPPALEEVQDEIIARLQQELIDTQIEALRMSADIELAEGVSPSIIRESELLEANE